ncbi:hypothetical protein [Streptomyces bottropensis]|uniref:hypothetical protein n=1 Tax=Streptomyces bottropensis TaxID=42235 RepID=UPI00367D4A69
MINISSVGGKFAVATYGAYAGAKFAREAVSDSLRREVAPLGYRWSWSRPAASAPRWLPAGSRQRTTWLPR